MTTLAETLSEAVLTQSTWIFGQRGREPLSTTLRFGEIHFGGKGRIEGYSHPNEATWSIKDGVLDIYMQSGDLMWRSDRVVTDPLGRVGVVFRNNWAEFYLIQALAADHPPKLPLGTADFLFPNDLQVTPTSVHRVLLIGSCLTGLYLQQFTKRVPDVAFDYVLFNYASELPPTPPAAVETYDFQYVQIPLRSVLGDRIVGAKRFNEPGYLETVVEDGKGIIDVMLKAALGYNERHGLLTFVASFTVPQGGASPSLSSSGTMGDLIHVIQKLNEHLAYAVTRYRNVYRVDVDTVAASIGKRFVLDDSFFYYSHGAVQLPHWADMTGWIARNEPIPPMDTFYETKLDEFIDCVWRQLLGSYRTVRQLDQVKAVVFDLDNTLWRGQIAEDYRSDRERLITDGWPLGIWEAIHHLRARGIMVAICSKNDHETVVRMWPDVVDPAFVSLDDFVSVKINWRTKAENILEICQELNIKPKSVVFVDDNPVERAAVKAALPAIRVMGGNPYMTRRILLWSAETQVAALTDESTRREVMIKRQIEREETRTAMTRDEFLASLGCKVTLIPITSVHQPQFGRVLELTNKTNQFNTTGRRWAHAEVERFLAEGGRLLAFSVADRFTDYGLVGVLFLEGTTIVQYVMSCRVLGMEIEEFVVSSVVEDMRARSGNLAVTAFLVETPDNTPCRDVFARSGFEMVGADGASREFRLEAVAVVRRPAHIAVDA